LPGDGTTKREVGGGTGFIFDESGLILTNRHVVSDLNAEYSVILNDGEQYEATVLGRDTVQDIAVLKIDVLGLQTVSLGDSDNLQIGQTVIAIGNTLSEYRNTVTRGVVSGIDRSIIAGGGGDSELIEEAIQTDAAINPGNSGGPLLNLAGEVVGINTAVNFQGQSIGFAIPVNNAKTVVESVLEYGKIVRPWLGVRYVQLDKQIAENNELDYDYGALIVQGQSRADLAIVPDSPADEAGLEENDIILEVNQVKLDDSTSLVKEINKFKPGDEVELLVFQEDKEIIIKVTLTERDSS
jgi:serine protease Do